MRQKIEMTISAIKGKDIIGVTSYLGNYRVSANAIGNHGSSLLLYAAQHGTLKIVKLLVERGADIFHRNFYDTSALDFATIHRCGALDDGRKIVDYLVGKGLYFRHSVFEYSYCGALKKLKRIPLRDQVKCSTEGYAALHYAIAGEQHATIKYLLENYVAVTKQHKNHYPPLLLAALYGKFKTIKYLFEKGFSLSEEDRKGNNVFLLAASSGHLEIVHWLVVEKNASITKKNIEQKIALVLAKERGMELVTLYLDICHYLMVEKTDLSNIQQNKIIDCINQASDDHALALATCFTELLMFHYSKNLDSQIFENYKKLFNLLFYFPIITHLSSKKSLRNTMLFVLSRLQNQRPLAHWVRKHLFVKRKLLLSSFYFSELEVKAIFNILKKDKLEAIYLDNAHLSSDTWKIFCILLSEHPHVRHLEKLFLRFPSKNALEKLKMDNNKISISNYAKFKEIYQAALDKEISQITVTGNYLCGESNSAFRKLLQHLLKASSLTIKELAYSKWSQLKGNYFQCYDDEVKYQLVLTYFDSANYHERIIYIPLTADHHRLFVHLQKRYFDSNARFEDVFYLFQTIIIDALIDNPDLDKCTLLDLPTFAQKSLCKRLASFSSKSPLQCHLTGLFHSSRRIFSVKSAWCDKSIQPHRWLVYLIVDDNSVKLAIEGLHKNGQRFHTLAQLTSNYDKAVRVNLLAWQDFDFSQYDMSVYKVPSKMAKQFFQYLRE